MSHIKMNHIMHQNQSCHTIIISSTDLKQFLKGHPQERTGTRKDVAFGLNTFFFLCVGEEDREIVCNVIAFSPHFSNVREKKNDV